MTIGVQDRRQFREEGYLVIPELIDGEDLKELDVMVNRLLDGELQPEIPYRGYLPDHFYTFWEPGRKDRTDLPRRQRIRFMASMCYHHPYFRALARNRAIHDVFAGLF